MVTDGSTRRLHTGERQAGSTTVIETSSAQANPRRHPGQEAMLGVSQYLRWPQHMHKGIVNKDIVMLLEENKQSIKLCLSTIMRSLRWNEQTNIQARFGRQLKNECKILRDKFITNSDYLDSQHLERSGLAASQPKRRIEQSRENLMIVRKEDLRDTSPLYKQQLQSDRSRQRAKALKELLEANARCNEKRRDAAKNDIRKIVVKTGQSNPELRKEMIYFWEEGFIEDKDEESTQSPKKTILRKEDYRKSGQALRKPLKGKIVTESNSSVKTSAASIYRKSDIAQAKISLPHDQKERKTHRRNHKRSCNESALQNF